MNNFVNEYYYTKLVFIKLEPVTYRPECLLHFAQTYNNEYSGSTYAKNIPVVLNKLVYWMNRELNA